MPVEVCEAVLIHEPVILRFCVRRAASSDGFGDEVFYFLAAIAAKANKDFSGLGRVADCLWCEFTEFRMCEQHDINRFANNDARRRIVCELWIVRIT